MLVAIEKTDGRAKDGSVLWRVRCDCSNELVCTVSSFRRRYSCGCVQRPNSGRYTVKDLSGVVMRDCTVLRPTEERKHTYTVWVVQCELCGEEFQRAAYAITKGTLGHNCKAWRAKH